MIYFFDAEVVKVFIYNNVQIQTVQEPYKWLSRGVSAVGLADLKTCAAPMPDTRSLTLCEVNKFPSDNQLRKCYPSFSVHTNFSSKASS